MKKLMYFAAVVLGLTACDNEETIVPTAEKVAIEVEAGIQTRVTGSAWNRGDTIGLNSIKADVATKVNNVPYTYYGSYFDCYSKPYFGDDKAQTFSAYYPYYPDSLLTDGWTPEENILENNARYDFLFATGASASKASPVVSFNGSYSFRHCMAQIQLIIKAGEGVTLEPNAQGFLAGPCILGQFNTKTGETRLAENPRVEAMGFRIPEGLFADNPDETTYTPQPVNIFPQTVSISPGGAPYPYVYLQTSGSFLYCPLNPKYETEPIVFEAGKRYTYTITFTKSEVSLEQTSITTWAEQPNVELIGIPIPPSN